MCASVVLASSPASAQQVDAATRAAARDLGYAGVSAYQAGDYQTATAKLEKAYAVLQAPSLGLWSARALVRVGKLVEASERYVDVTRLEVSGGDVAVHEQAKKDARVENEALVPKIPRLVVRVQGVDAGEVAVTIDGKRLAGALVGERAPVNPGAHLVRGTRGEEVVEARVSVPAGGEESVELVFKGGPLPAAVPGDAAQAGAGATPGAASESGAPPQADRKASGGTSTMRTLGWIGVIGGGAALAGGAATGIVVLDWKNQIDNSDNLQRSQSARNRYETLRIVSLASLIGGGAITLAGVVLLVAAPPSDASATSAGKSFVGVRVLPNGLVVHGKF